jgi:putative NADH-flavin reductase
MFSVAHSQGSRVVVVGGAVGIRIANSVLMLEEAALTAFVRRKAERKQKALTTFMLAILSSRI